MTETDNNKACLSKASKIPENQNAKAFMQPLCISKDKILDQPPADHVWEMKMSSDLSSVFAGKVGNLSEFSPNCFLIQHPRKEIGKPTLIIVFLWCTK